MEQLRLDYEVLTGDMLLASAFVSYAGPFTNRFRKELIAEWAKFSVDRSIPMTEGLMDPLKVHEQPRLCCLGASESVCQVLVDDALVAGWVREGLPSDPTSIQNGTILTNSERWPLMLDPQLQGIDLSSTSLPLCSRVSYRDHLDQGEGEQEQTAGRAHGR